MQLKGHIHTLHISCSRQSCNNNLMAYFQSLLTFIKLIDNNSYLQINDQFRIHSEGSYTQRLLVWRLTTHKYGQMFRPRQIWSSACAPYIKISSHFEGCGWMPNVQLPYKLHFKRLNWWFPLNSRTQDKMLLQNTIIYYEHVNLYNIRCH